MLQKGYIKTNNSKDCAFNNKEIFRMILCCSFMIFLVEGVPSFFVIWWFKKHRLQHHRVHPAAVSRITKKQATKSKDEQGAVYQNTKKNKSKERQGGSRRPKPTRGYHCERGITATPPDQFILLSTNRRTANLPSLGPRQVCET